MISGQLNDIQNLTNYFKENNDSLNFNKIDSVTTLFLRQHPKIDEEIFQKLLNELYTEDNLNQLASYYFINGLFYEAEANYITAIKAYLTAIEFIAVSNSNNYLVYYKTAYCYERLGYSQKAIDYYLKSVAYPDIKADKLIEIYKNIGNCSTGLKKYDQSIKYYNKSYKAAELIADTITMIKTVINSGNTYLRAKNYSKAFELTNRAYHFAKENNYYLGISFSKYNLGLIELETNNTKTAIKNFKEALSIAKEHEINYVIINSQLLIAKSYLKQKEYKKSLEYLEKYFELVNRNTPNSKKLSAYKIRSEALLYIGNYSLAIKNNDRLINVVDSILVSSQKKYLENIETTRTLEKNIIENKMISKELEINRLRYIESKRMVWLSIFVLALLILIIVQLFYTKKKQNKYVSKILHQNKIIAEKNSEINQQSEELRNTNESLLEYQQKLENKVNDRTKELNEALEHAKQQSELKSAFLRNISHEIRTPLNGIMGFVQIISLNNPEIEKEYLKIIQQNSHDLTYTVDNLIELAEIETSEIKVNIQNFNLENFVEEIKKKSFYIRRNLVKEDIDFHVRSNNINRESNWISDKNLLFKILYHLTHNAFKYTEQGNVVIDFNLDDSKFSIKISDTGIGMDKEYLDKIFDSFIKLEYQGKLFRGTGAGLTIVKYLSQKINVVIDMQSVEEKGTTILLTLTGESFV
ncbi:MAG: ATP-binding protein [Bacteroidota bacterium]